MHQGGSLREIGGALRSGGAAACVFAMLVLGCGDSGVVVNNKNPLGTVGGLVVDGASQQPLDGVAVRILSAGGTFDTTTGTDGFYKLADVPAGTFTVQLTKDGFLPVRIQGALNGAVGNFPISSPIYTAQPIGLVSVGPDFIVRVVDSNGVAVTGATASARMPFSYVDLAQGTPQFTGSTIVSATTAADGRLVFKGLPDVRKFGPLLGSYTYDPSVGYITADTAVVSIAPILVTGQENYQYAGGIFRFRLFEITQSVVQIVLSGPTDPLTILESNIEWLRTGFANPSPGNYVNGSVIEASGPITIAFSEAVNPATLRAQVTTESGQPGPALTPTVNLNLVSLAGNFNAGARYNLLLTADAALNPAASNRQRTANVPFFIKPTDAKPTVVSAKLTAVAAPGTSTVVFTLSEPIGFGDGVAQTYDCVVFYEGSNFDGSTAGQSLVIGEWATDANALSCVNTTPVVGVTAPITNNGRLTGTENKDNPGVASVTGFSPYFTASFAPFVITLMPAMPAAGYVAPAVGSKGHLYFTKTVGSVRRPNGEPITDLPFTLQ